MSRPQRNPTPPNPYGAYSAADGLGGVAAPLLAGFAVTLLGLVLQVEKAMRWPDLALLLFGGAGVLFLKVVQYNARARNYVVTFGEALEWYGDADDPERRKMVLWELEHHRLSWHFWIGRSRNRYNLGIVLLLLGTAVLLVPKDAGELTGVRGAAIAVLVLGAGLEAFSILFDGRVARLSPRRRVGRWGVAALRWAAPPEPPVPAPPFPDREPPGRQSSSGSSPSSDQTPVN